MRDLLLLAFTGVSTVVAVFQPVVGFLAYTFIGIVGPQGMAWGIGKALPVSKIIGAGILLGYVLWREKKSIPIRRETILLVFLLAVFGMSTIFAVREVPALGFFPQIAKIIIMVVLGAALINTPERLRLYLYVVALSIGALAVKGGIFAIVSGGQYHVWGPEGNYLYANTSIGLAMAINIPLLHFLIRTEGRSWLRILLWAIMALSVPAIVCTFSRGAWLGMAAAFLLILLRRPKLLILAIPVGALAILLALVVLPSGKKLAPEAVSKRYGELVDYKQETSAQSRFWNWELCWRVGKANPLTGAGFDYYSLEVTSRYFPEFLQRWPGKVWSCHSVWFSIFGEHGVPGFVLWVLLLFSCLLSLRRIRKAGKRHPESAWLVDFADMVQASFITYMVVGTFLDAAYFEIIYQLMTTIIAAQVIIQGFDNPGRVAGTDEPVSTGTGQPDSVGIPILKSSGTIS